MKGYVSLLVALGLMGASATHAETLQEYAEKCKAELGIDRIPGYSCRDGIRVTPENEGFHLVPNNSDNTWFGTVATSNPDVDAVFLCRDTIRGNAILNGYILQNRKTGKACFFDSQNNASSANIPDPDAPNADAHWRSPATLHEGGACLGCHNNDPFVISRALVEPAKELGLIGGARPMGDEYFIVEDEADIFQTVRPPNAPQMESPLFNGNNKIRTNVTNGSGNCAQSCHTVSGVGLVTTITRDSGMPPAPGSPFVSWPTGQIMHMDSGKCVHPLFGTAHEGTKAVVWFSCDFQDRLMFEFTSTGRLQEQASQKCLDVNSAALNQNVFFTSDCNGARQFIVTNNGQLKVNNTNFCVEPAVANRSNDTELVLKTCSNSANQRFASIPVVERKIVQTTSNMCWRTEDGNEYPAGDKRVVVLSNDCQDNSSSFTLLANGLIKHIPSGYCVHPAGGTAEIRDVFVLFPSCNFRDDLVFEITEQGNIKHTKTGMCAHPYLGSATPDEGTPVVFWPTCDNDVTFDNDRLRFTFERK